VQTLATNLPYPGDIAVDTNNLYFTSINDFEGGSSDGLFVCAKSGCLPDGGVAGTLAAGISEDPGDIVVQGTTMYFSDYARGVFVCTLPACANATAFPGPGFGVKGIAVDATRFYWTDQSAGVVYACPIAGCDDGGAPVVLGSGLAYPNQIALDTSYVYISVGNQSPADAGLNMGIYRLPK
jgi:hypothetical protein